jgi:Cu(I)/Ag(I) efflux system membrane fusion protein
VYLADVHVPFIGPGHPAEVRIATLGGEVFAGAVSRLGHAQDPRTRTMRAEIDLPNEHGRLRSGMYAAVTIRVPASSGHMTVPAECLVDLPGKGERGVYVLREGRPVLTPVRVGRSADGRTELLSGLGATDEIVVNWPEIDARASGVAMAGPLGAANATGGGSAVLLP